MPNGVKCFNENLNQQGDRKGWRAGWKMIAVFIKSCQRKMDEMTFEKISEDVRDHNTKCLVSFPGL